MLIKFMLQYVAVRIMQAAVKGISQISRRAQL